MPNRNDISKFLTRVAATFVCTSTWVLACDMSYSEVKVGREFEVVVGDRGRALAAVEVRITRGIEKPEFHFETVASKKTDSNGRVYFKRIKKGRYSIAVTHAGIEGSAAYLVVIPGHAPERVGMEWPLRNILKVQTIAGTFNARFYRDTGRGVLDLAHKQEGPFSNQTLSLTRA